MRISDWSSDVCSSDLPGLPLDRRVALVRDFSVADPAAFRRLVFHVYDSYYQDEGVCAAIGARPGQPFPRGYDIPAGDLSSLEAVKTRGKIGSESCGEEWGSTCRSRWSPYH